MKLEGRVAAITGGTAGIGRAIAEAYLGEGARVVVNGRNADRGKQVAAELGDPDRVQYHQGDATTKDGVEGTVEAAVERFGRIDIMVNNAGGAARLVPCVDLYDEDWDLCMKWNLYSTFWGTRAALRHMLPQKWGRIINVSSIEGKHGKPVLSPYVAAKHAINGFTKAVAKEVGTEGITVNAICPGLVITDIILTNGPRTAEAMGLTFEQMVDLFAEESAIKRPNTLDEVAAVALLLASDVAAGITGSIYSVDGGTAAY
ncbi:MAG TPA: SDR family oxidoreductase [Kribbellaceae bacterium]|jgi:NAD(P)-dependent dehydrogenase (short-subunit alcohol dehydrogenase family)